MKSGNMTVDAILAYIEEEDVRFVSLRFTDIRGQEHQMSLPAHRVDEDLFEMGQPFDGSSLPAWKGIEASDMSLVPDPKSMRMDPFAQYPTMILTCDIYDPSTFKGYDRDPRSIARRAEAFLVSSGIGDVAYFGPEPEFFVFDGVRWSVGDQAMHFDVQADEGDWAKGADTMFGMNHGHRPGKKGGYAPVAPLDQYADMRMEMCDLLEEQGVPVEIHHHEVAPNQLEIGTRFSTLVERADWNQIFKYTVHNVAHQYEKTATFMPKPIFGDNGSGMHVHQSIWKNGQNLFAGHGYAGLSDMALYYIGGIIKHAKALNAICNPSTNSYKRLVPHFEAPVKLAYSASNRSAAIRIPAGYSVNARRIEARFPDPLANPYICFAALLMAGLDGVQNKIHPGDPATKNLYDLPPEEDRLIPTVAASLDQALDALEADFEFLLKGDVFTRDFIESFVELKRAEARRLAMSISPHEFDMYYSL